MGLENKYVEQFIYFMQNVRIKDVRVCIMEMPIDNNLLYTFMYAYPFKDCNGGMIKIFNPSYILTSPYANKEFKTKTLLWQTFERIKIQALKNNENLRLIYDGIIGRDMNYGT